LGDTQETIPPQQEEIVLRTLGFTYMQDILINGVTKVREGQVQNSHSGKKTFVWQVKY
jgi:hypothetical protein